MTAVLSQRRHQDAVAFIEREARPLDQALWRHSLAGSNEAAIAALAPFQNTDGGFGHGLEPDLATPASTAIAASVGLRCLRRAGAAADHPMVTGALGWLENAINEGVWPIITPAVDEAPHAPWWTWSGDLAAQWSGFRWNPSAELLAALYHYQISAPAGLIEAAEARMRRSIAETEVIEGAYDLRCARILAETLSAPADLRADLATILRRSVAAHDPDDQHVSALDLAPTPTSLLADVLASGIGAAAARLISQQQADGGWTVFWDWSEVDAAAWAKARRDWRGALTREALEVLRAYGRVDGV